MYHRMKFCYTTLDTLRIDLEILLIHIFYLETEECLSDGMFISKYLIRKDDEYENAAEERVY